MTGFFVHVKRDSGAALTDQELDTFLARQQESDPDGKSAKAWQWVRSLARWIRDNVKEERR